MYLTWFNCSLDALPPPLELVSRNLTSPADETCYDIRYCRTISNIIWSCVATILACTWVVIHPNIPAHDAHWLNKLGRRITTTIYAIIAPEVVVLWAVKQWLTSRRLAEKHSNRGWTQTHGFFAIMGGFAIYKENRLLKVVDPYKDLDKLGIKVAEQGVGSSPTDSRGAVRKPSQSSRLLPDAQWDGSGPDESEIYLLPYQSERTPQESQTDTRASRDEEPQSMDDKVDIKTLPFPDISKEEIKDRSKGDWISKGLAILQTSWFILQCIARTAQKLPVTELELATCAFAALNAITYGLWWNKPQSVDCPYPIGRRSETDIGVQSKEASRSRGIHIAEILRSIWSTLNFDDEEDNSTFLLMSRVLSPLDPLTSMIYEDEITINSTHVPPYYAGSLSDRDQTISTIVVIACSTVFGAIHCIGWSFDFPSRVDQLLWRSCSLAITCLPLIEAAVLSLYLLTPFFEKLREVLGETGRTILLWGLMVPNLILYMSARITLLVLAFVSLKALPPAAYQNVSWTNIIPHI